MPVARVLDGELPLENVRIPSFLEDAGHNLPMLAQADLFQEATIKKLNSKVSPEATGFTRNTHLPVISIRVNGEPDGLAFSRSQNIRSGQRVNNPICHLSGDDDRVAAHRNIFPVGRLLAILDERPRSVAEAPVHSAFHPHPHGSTNENVAAMRVVAGDIQNALNEIRLAIVAVIAHSKNIERVAVADVKCCYDLAIVTNVIQIARQVPPILACGHSSNDARNLIVVDHFL